MASIRKHYKKYQVLIRKKGHPHICKTFESYSDATKYAQESESNIAKGLFADLAEANQTLLRDTLQRYKDSALYKLLEDPKVMGIELGHEGVLEAINLLQSSGLLKKGGKVK